MTENKQHRDLQIQWHEDCIHSLETGEPMREWESKRSTSNLWYAVSNPLWYKNAQYRRKTKTLEYWHCIVQYVVSTLTDEKIVKSVVALSPLAAEEAVIDYKRKFLVLNVSPIIKTTTEIPE